MAARMVATMAALAILALIAPAAAADQAPQSPAPQAAPLITPAQIDQLIAPIALYPDPILSQILMAASYPVEVVEADRWRQDPANAGLQGEELVARLNAETWDPSVKSLVPFLQILAMMDGNLVWTERLGEAFIAQPAEVMDEVQRLRRAASADGGLGSNGREVVNQANGDIAIQPADPSDVSVPEYDPETAYGTWPDPDYPPYYFSDYFSDCSIGEFGYCWSAWPIVGSLWGWDSWDWRNHHIKVDHDRFARLDRGRNPLAGDVWRHDPSHRRDTPYQTPAVGARYPAAVGAEGARGVRGYFGGAEPRMVLGGEPRTVGATEPRSPPTFESYGSGSGAAVRAQAERGEVSRAQIGGFGGGNFGSRGGGGFAASRGFGGGAVGGGRRR